MTAEAPLTSVDFMSDGATLAVGSTRGELLWISFSKIIYIFLSMLVCIFLISKASFYP